MLPSADFHLHTHHSGDSPAPMGDLVNRAVELGLSDICFTDHLDLDYPQYDDLPEGAFDLDFKAYHDEVSFFQDKFKDRINIGYGVEIGMQPQVAKENSEIVKRENFDFVIASIHLIDQKDPYYPEFWPGHDPSDVLRHYFEITLENLLLFDDYDVLGHIDYLVRYVPKGTEYSYAKYSDVIDAILLHIIKKDKGLDFNSKAVSKPAYGGNPNPHPDVLKRYKELGGRIITFGSDAHTPDAIAGSFDKMRDIAISCGFNEYCTFSGRTPAFHKL